MSVQAERVDFPPRLRLLEQAVVCRGLDRPGARGGMWLGQTQRNYERTEFNLEPADPAKGSKWVVYDTGQRKVVELISDLNALCGQETRPGSLGQRVYASKQVGQLLGTGPAEGNGDFAGGHIVRAGKDLGSVGPGWSVVAFDQHWQGKVALEGKEHPKCSLALVRSGDGTKYQILTVLDDRLAPLGIEGGKELEGFLTTGSTVWWRSPDAGVVGRSVLGAGEPEVVGDEGKAFLDALLDPNWFFVPGGSLDPRWRGPCFGLRQETGDLVKIKWSGRASDLGELGRHEGVLKGARTESTAQWPGISRWLTQFGWAGRANAESPDAALIEQGGMQEGYLCFGRDGRDDEPGHLFCYRPAAGPPVDLGPLPPVDGQALSKVFKVRIFTSGKVAVVAGNGEIAAVQIYEGPVIDTLSAQLKGHLGRVVAGAEVPALKVRTIDNLYRYAEHADRGFDSMATASDGRLYVCTMPHHPTRGAPICVYDPKLDRVSLLGEFDVLAGNVGPDRIPSMMHDPPFEMNGRLYFTGQDPFYGSYRFPGMCKEYPGMVFSEPNYVGSPVLAYDLKKGEFQRCGTPVERVPKEIESLFHITGDPKRSLLFFGFNYGARVWYSQRVGQDGELVGAPRKLELGGKPHLVHVGPDGNLYYPLLREVAEDRGEKKTDGKRPPCDIYRFDPETGKREVAASFDVVALHGREFSKKFRGTNNACGWIKGQYGVAEVVAHVGSAGMLIKVDLNSGGVKKVCLWQSEELGPLRGGGEMLRSGDKVYWFNWKPGTKVMTSQLRVADLKSGQVTEYGRIVDTEGRTVRQVTQAAVGPDGRIYIGGSMFGLPSDQHYCRRNIFSPVKVITGLCELRL